MFVKANKLNANPRQEKQQQQQQRKKLSKDQGT